MQSLPGTDRAKVWRALMRYWSSNRESVAGMTKSNLVVTVNAADNWVSRNIRSFDNALPEPFKSNATAKQKALLLVAIVLLNYNLDLLKRVFGDVD